MEKVRVDAVVVGAGVMGCAIAYEMSRRGHAVTVVERNGGAGTGSTGASSASIRFNYSELNAVATAWEAFHRWQDWADYLEASPGEPLARFVRTGGLLLPAPVQDTDLVLRHFDAVGVPYQRWSGDRIRTEFPWLEPLQHWPPKPVESPGFWEEPSGQDLCGVWVPDVGFTDDPMLATVNLMEAARRHGARFRFRTGVREIPSRAGRVQGVVTEDGSLISANVVINASGPHSGQVTQMADALTDFAVRTRPMRQEVHEVPAPAGFSTDGPGPMVADPDLGTYFRGTPSGRIIVGSTEPACDPLPWIDDPDGVDMHVTRKAYEAQVYRAARRLPGLRVPGSPKGIIGIYDVSTDWAPIYDRTAVSGFYVAIGTSGNQFKNAPVVGELMATLIEACESGHDHDHSPVRMTLARTGHEINIGVYSRLRKAGLGAGVLG